MQHERSYINREKIERDRRNGIIQGYLLILAVIVILSVMLCYLLSLIGAFSLEPEKIPPPISMAAMFLVSIDVKKIYRVKIEAKDEDEAKEKGNAMQSTAIDNDGDLQDVETEVVAVEIVPVEDEETEGLSEQARIQIDKLQRLEIEILLTNAGIQCYDSESTELLRDALRVNVADGTISESDIFPNE